MTTDMLVPISHAIAIHTVLGELAFKDVTPALTVFFPTNTVDLQCPSRLY
jgi:hypothetical protein